MTDITSSTLVSIGEMVVSCDTNFSQWQQQSAGETELQKPNIPRVEVGSINLTGSGTYNSMGYVGTMNVTMNNTKFFAATS